MDENTTIQDTKFCKECGAKIARKAVVCPHCGCSAEDTTHAQPQIVINNSNQNQNNVSMQGTGGRRCNKWTSFLLCLFLGLVGGHKFYEGKIGAGLLYMCTGGLFFVGAIIDLLNILGKSNPYIVY